MPKDTSEFDERYLKGFENKGIRYFYYLNQGLNILNQFRNLFLGIIALYIALKLENVTWLIIMFLPALLILTVVGYYTVHKMNTVNEWIGIRFSTHFAKRQFDYTQKQMELLEEIRDLLKK